jgi:hypothetical protein
MKSLKMTGSNMNSVCAKNTAVTRQEGMVAQNMVRVRTENDVNKEMCRRQIPPEL